MLPSSVRRVATAACQSSPILSTFAPAASITGLCVAGRRNASQRRSSSSKPSSSDNGSKKVAADDSVTPSSVERDSKPGGEKRKRRPKTAKCATKDLPSVPNTNHLSQQTIALTSFFSLHRPISVTEGFPSTVSDDAFASIFTSRGPASPSDVISTFTSDTIDQLDQPMTKLVLSTKDGAGVGEQEVKIYQQVVNALPNLFDQLNAMSGKFSPFTSPPTPEEEGITETSTASDTEEPHVAQIQANEDAQADQHVQYRAVITIDQTTKPDGRVEVVAHSPELLEDPDHTETRRGRKLSLISVKRIRKLKMKKKKYKKLMRRTRNARRKLDRL